MQELFLFFFEYNLDYPDAYKTRDTDYYSVVYNDSGIPATVRGHLHPWSYVYEPHIPPLVLYAVYSLAQ